MVNRIINRFAKKRTHTFVLNTIIIPTRAGGFTGFYEEFPEIIAEGDTEKELEENLLKTLEVALEYRRRQHPGEGTAKGLPQKKSHQTFELAS